MRHLARQRPLIGHRERADLVDLVAEELDAERVVRHRREDIEDAAAQGELAATRDHVDAVVGELDESRRRPRRGRSPRPPTARSIGATSARPAARGCSAPRTEDVTMSGVSSRPRGDAPQHLEPAADGLGARAQPLVRQRLPRGEVHDLGVGHERLERRAERFRAAARRRDREERRRPARRAAALEQGREKRGVEPVGRARSLHRRMPRPRHPGTIQPARGRARSRELSPEESTVGRRHRIDAGAPRMSP